jgi:hypothetical protein
LLLIFVMTAVGSIFFKNTPTRDGLMGRYLDDIFNISIVNLVILIGFSLIGYFGSRILVSDSSDVQYSILGVVFQFGWFHLNIGEILYAFFYALGPFFLAFLIVLFSSTTRDKLIKKMCDSNINFAIFLPFCIAGAIFMMVGGTDGDRFLLWFFPFYGYLGLISIGVLLDIGNKKVNYSVIFILLIGLVWTKFYVPATPNLFFPGDKYRSMAGVKTNYDPKLYYGIPLMEKFRLPLKKVPRKDFSSNEPIFGQFQLKGVVEPMIPDDTPRISDKQNPYRGAYRYEINNIPFPLGFSHNQYELLIAHPFWGSLKIKAAILLQWLSILGFIVFWNKKTGYRPSRRASAVVSGRSPEA